MPDQHDQPGTPAASIGAFDEAAADFQRLAPQLWDPFAEATLALARPSSGEFVLDACCGTGASAVPSAVAVGPTGRVDAVDISAAMTDQLRRRRDTDGLIQLRAAVADVTRWDRHGYDLVVSVMGVFFLPDLDRDTRTLVGRCRPGGRAAVTIWRRGAMDAFGAALADTVADVARRPRGQRPRGRFDEINERDNYQAWLTGLGLTEVEVHERPWQLSVDPELCWLLVIGSGFRGMLANLTDNQIAEVRAELWNRVSAAGAEVDASSLIGLGVRR